MWYLYHHPILHNHKQLCWWYMCKIWCWSCTCYSKYYIPKFGISKNKFLETQASWVQESHPPCHYMNCLSPFIPWTKGLFHECLVSSPRHSQEFLYCRILTSYENLKLKLCTCSQSHALRTRTKFPLEILTINVIPGIVYFHEIILESLWNISKTTPNMTLMLSALVWFCLHMETMTKWLWFSRRHFQMYFLEWKCMNFD